MQRAMEAAACSAKSERCMHAIMVVGAVGLMTQKSRSIRSHSINNNARSIACLCVLCVCEAANPRHKQGTPTGGAPILNSIQIHAC